ncbi:hypothetical protein HKX48_004444 [Thoreauomyces humboldtii]|nr:hypothetical protein HKX48_004444 [Thoreauomyces humboldtii]
MTDQAEAIPPHHPLHNVSLTLPEIRTIVSTALPSTTFISSTPFPPNASYNNKLYHIAVDTSDPFIPRNLVLRLCGRHWTRTKTVNEVACLSLLAGTGLVPRVFGWCAEGPQEWILMERMEGRSLAEEMTVPDLTMEDQERVAEQLAHAMRVWRDGMRRDDGSMGNLEKVGEDGSVVFGPFVDGVHARGYPWTSYAGYARALLEDAIVSLSTKPALEGNRHLDSNHVKIPLVQSFIETTLPTLPVLYDPVFSSSVFTHGDMNARNILVSRDPTTYQLKLSAIVDFEWAGFFPLYHEFAASEGEAFDPSMDGCLDRALLNAMEKVGLTTVRTADPVMWKQAKALDGLRTNVAPWWLMQLDVGNPRLPGELAEAAEVVKGILGEFAVTFSTQNS